MSRTNFISSHTSKAVRVVGLSTALANARDLADWLGIKQVWCPAHLCVSTAGWTRGLRRSPEIFCLWSRWVCSTSALRSGPSPWRSTSTGSPASTTAPA